MADGAGPSGSGQQSHQSFEQFISQFNSRASLQGGGNVEASSLKPTAAEFVPRWQQDSNGGPSRQEHRGAARRQYDRPQQQQQQRWNDGRRNNFGRNQRGRNFNDSREGGSEEQRAGPPAQQRNGGRWKGNAERFRNGRGPRNEPEVNGRREEAPPEPVRERRPNAYQRNRARQEKLEANMISKCSQREKLIRELDTGRVECLVCCELVRPTQSVWSCLNCYHILHLTCTTKWANSSQSDDGWRCPACQNVSKKIPREYFCFCGKLKNPVYNRSDVAHSCGEVCGREELCDHPCTLLCHPGPCPPCQAMVQRSCGCGRMTKPLQCSQKEEIACDAVCSKPLNCEIHCCQRKCHVGGCNDCEESLEHECHCGKQKKQVTCTVSNLDNTKFCCEEVCDAQLDRK